jgi:hypothetical protein
MANRPDLLFGHFEELQRGNDGSAGATWQRLFNLRDDKDVIGECFELLAWSATSGELIEQLDAGRLHGHSRQNALESPQERRRRLSVGKASGKTDWRLSQAQEHGL